VVSRAGSRRFRGCRSQPVVVHVRLAAWLARRLTPRSSGRPQARFACLRCPPRYARRPPLNASVRPKEGFGLWRILLVIVASLLFGGCETTLPKQLSYDAQELLTDPFAVAALAAEYRCSRGSWPQTAGDLFAFETERNAKLKKEMTYRAWQILEQCSFQATSSGSLRIQGRFEPHAYPFPAAEQPIEINLNIETGDCPTSAVENDPEGG